jgi:NAD(P)-dependent dehydrogenase (short-subunit alcohol dehydrogenase family)
MGAHLAITGRDRGRTEGAAEEIRAAGGGQVEVFVADLSSQSEARLAEEVLQRLPRIDVLVNNVGGYWNTRHVTADGLERTPPTERPHEAGRAPGQPHPARRSRSISHAPFPNGPNRLTTGDTAH